MDNYFFDNPLKAIIKGGFLLVTYVCSIVFKQFSIAVVLPTVLIYFLSNISDYIELAFIRKDKIRKIRYWSLGIFIYMLLVAILTFGALTTDNTNIQNFVNNYYVLIYLLCFVVLAIPFYDGIKCQCDDIRKTSVKANKHFNSNVAYNVMNNDTLKS